MRSVLAFLICAFWLSVSTAQTLWGDTVYGMPLEEVQRLIPEAKPPEGKGNTLYGGAEELLRIEQFELVDKMFTVGLYFKENKLVQVMMSLRPESLTSTMSTFEALSDALRAKYGTEVSRRDSPGSSMTAQAIWLSGRTNITLSVMSSTPSFATLWLNYQVRVAREADKL